MQGDVSNYVETEQIVSTKGKISSFVQVRGSIPCVWEQKPNVKYEPPIVLSDSKRSQQAAKKHFEEQLLLYKRQAVVSLIKEKGGEKKLGDELSELMKLHQSDTLKYYTFDLHHHCGTSKFHKLSILFDQIDGDIDTHGFAVCVGDKLTREQEGVMRTNCKDNLDRTNLVQSKIAIRAFWSQLQALEIPAKRGGQEENHLETLHRHVWADNGDYEKNHTKYFNSNYTTENCYANSLFFSR